MRTLPMLVIAVLGTTSLARAETPQEQADKLFAEGRKLLIDEKNPQAACEKFEAAIALDSTAPGVMLNLGLCNQELKRFATSLYWFRKAQTAASENKLDEYEEAAKKSTRENAQLVPIGTIDVSKAPPNVEITIEGRRVLPSDYGRIELDYGENHVEARAPDKAPLVFLHTVTAQAAGTIKIEMQTERRFETYDAGAGRRKLAYVTGGVAVATGIACLVANIKWHGDAKDAKNATPPDDDKREAANDKILKYGTTLFGVSVAAGVASVILYVTAPGIEKRELNARRILPYTTGDSVGIGFSGRF